MPLLLTPALTLTDCISMMARSIGPPGTTRVIRKTMMVIPNIVGGINKSLRRKYDRINKSEKVANYPTISTPKVASVVKTVNRRNSADLHRGNR
jgi:hypothetical protein